MPFERPFENIVGPAPEKMKEDLSGDLRRELETQEEWTEKFGKYERKKTKEEEEMVRFVDREVSKTALSYGANSTRRVPEKSFHFIPEKYWTTVFGEKEGAGASSFLTYILVSDKSVDKTKLLEYLFHEVVHQKDYVKIETIKTREEKQGEDIVKYFDWKLRRGGYQFYHKGMSKQEKNPAFCWLNEALTQELSGRFTEQMIKNPPPRYKEDFETLKKARKVFGRKGFEEKEISIGKEHKKFFGLQKSWAIIYRQAYYGERQKLWQMIDEIYKKNPEKFEDKDEKTAKEEIFSLFAKGMFTGKILESARLIEKTFGKGSFKKLGEWTPE